MPSIRRPLIAAIATLPLLAAADTASAGFQQARFTATFKASLVTKWNLPRHTTPQDCYHVRWRHGMGEERWEIKSRGTGAKVLATKSGGKNVGWLTGWTIGAAPVDFAAGGIIDRSSHLGEGWTPGPCGGEGGVVPPKKQDCGSRLPSYKLSLSQTGNLMYVTPLAPATGGNEKNFYDECFLPTPDGILQGDWPKVAGKLSRAAVFGGGRTLTARGKQTWTKPKHSASGTGTLSTTTTMDWTLTLKRAR